MRNTNGLAGAVEFTLAETGLPGRLLGAFPDILAEGGSRMTADQLASFRALGAGAATEGVALRDLVDLYLSLARRALPHLPGMVSAVAGRDTDGVRDAAADALRHTEEAVAALADGYSISRAQATQLAESLRREFVDDLLGGGVDEASLAGRAEVLGVALSGQRMVLAVGADRAMADYGPVMRRIEHALAGRFGAAEHIVAARRGLLGCVLPSDGTDTHRIADYLRDLARAAEPERVWRIAASRPREGAAGVAVSWTEAWETSQIADLLGAVDGGLVRACEVDGYRLLLRDRAAVAAVTAEVLAPLEGVRGGATQYVDTLLTWFTAGGNTAAAARVLHLSVRATLYRLDRIQRLTGYRLDDPAHRFTLHVAALGARLTGTG